MSYEIPQQLEYKEKIMFGLTFGQLGYLFFFGLIDFIIFKEKPAFFIPLLILNNLFALGFIFFNLAEKINIGFKFLSFRGLILRTRKIYKFMGIKKIDKEGMINQKGKKIAVLKVTSINFGIKTDEEQEAILIGFRKFLNSLDFPVQIVMNTEDINLDSYIEESDNKLKLYEELRQDYNKFLKETIDSNKINNRSFYVIIPEKNDLNVQVSICKDRLNGLRLKTKQLSINEVTELMKFYFDNNYDEKSKSIFDKIRPKSVKNKKNYVRVGETYCRIISASGYPRIIEGGFIDKIISLSGNFDLSIHIEPFPIETMMINLNRELQKQRADLYAAEKRNMLTPSLEIKYADTKSILELLQKGKEKLFNVSLYICCKAKVKEIKDSKKDPGAEALKELDILTKKIESELNSILIIPKVYSYRQAQGFRSILPIGIDDLKIKRNITSSALSAFFPFTSPFLQVDQSGVWLGLNKNKIPIIRDIFKLSNPNGVVLAQSGGGKSFFSKLLIARYLLSGVKVLVIDPQGEYRALAKQFRGEIIDLSKDSDNIINPLDMMNHDYTNKRLSLMDLTKIMFGDLSEPQRALLDKAITITYAEFGFGHETIGEATPILSDLKITLEDMSKKATNLEKPTINSIINRLEMYISGVFNFLNRQTNIDFNNQFVCFDISQLPKPVKPILMYLILDFVYSKMRENLDRKILLIDEAWTLLSRTEEASYIFEIVKTCRKFNMSLLLINQEVENLLVSQAGKSVLANSAYQVFLRQQPSVIKQITGTFNLSNQERELLLTAQVGQGILIMEDEHTELNIVASPKEYKVITTNADELAKTFKKKVNKVKIKSGNININEKRICLRVDRESKEHKNYLRARGYKDFVYHNFLTKKKERFLVKEKPTEKHAHIINVFLVEELLRKQKIKDIRLLSTVGPDIEFKIKDKIFAIEVETGTQLKVKKNLVEKAKYNDKKYGKNWAIFVTNRNLAKEYNEYGKVLTKKTFVHNINKVIKNGHWN